MDRIADANKSVITGIDAKDIENWVMIHIMGKAYEVPSELTILQAMEYSGYRFIRSCGCRAGFCGACATVYRKEGEYKLHGVLACQTKVEDGMFLVQIPFAPAEKSCYDITVERYDPAVLLKYYPEITRCVSCNTCTKACPQELQIMDYIQSALKGDFEGLADASFDCIQCGLCAIRCPAEIVHYHMAQLGRRMFGKYGIPEELNLKKRVEEIENRVYDEEFQKIMKMAPEDFKTLYVEKQKEREVY
ncbi:MAG: 2Fe-2S iron-sulfur cluster binding domain-containing protein [Planctomycetes bacterium]|nr:2Fe-2S iron-sulfur cluster binding domain-containing protein [Planctomycetota bacterium]